MFFIQSAPVQGWPGLSMLGLQLKLWMGKKWMGRGEAFRGPRVTGAKPQESRAGCHVSLRASETSGLSLSHAHVRAPQSADHRLKTTDLAVSSLRLRKPRFDCYRLLWVIVT